MDIYYLYAYETGQLLYIGRNKQEYEKIWNAYESQGVACYGQDFESMCYNIKLEQERGE